MSMSMSIPMSMPMVTPMPIPMSISMSMPMSIPMPMRMHMRMPVPISGHYSDAVALASMAPLNTAGCGAASTPSETLVLYDEDTPEILRVRTRQERDDELRALAVDLEAESDHGLSLTIARPPRAASTAKRERSPQCQDGMPESQRSVRVKCEAAFVGGPIRVHL